VRDHGTWFGSGPGTDGLPQQLHRVSLRQDVQIDVQRTFTHREA
jgi:hypothetical protein